MKTSNRILQSLASVSFASLIACGGADESVESTQDAILASRTQVNNVAPTTEETQTQTADPSNTGAVDSGSPNEGDTATLSVAASSPTGETVQARFLGYQWLWVCRCSNSAEFEMCSDTTNEGTAHEQCDQTCRAIHGPNVKAVTEWRPTNDFGFPRLCD